MDKILRPHSVYATAYLDDIIIYSNDWQRHLEHVRAVLRSLRVAGLTANLRKCAIGRVEVWYLGFHLGNGQVRPQIDETAAIAACPGPKTKKEVRQFLGLAGYYRTLRKRCTTNRENRSLMRIVKQNRFKNLGELHKEWTGAGVKASRATTHRRVKEFGYSCRIPLVKPLLNHRQRQRHLTWAKEKKNWTVAQWSKVLFSDESKFCI